MSADFAKVPYTARAEKLEDALSSLEGWTFGRYLRFSAHGYFGQLSINLDSGWYEIRRLRELPDAREFADALNAATKPVIDAYCKKLRQELANECVKIASKALAEPDAPSPPG